MGKFLGVIKNKLQSLKIKFNKRSQLAFAGILGLVVLIIFVNGIRSSGEVDISKEEELQQTIELGSYEQQMERRLEKILSTIEGVGRVNVFVMTETSVKTISAGNEDVKEYGENSDSKNQSFEIVFEKNGTTTKPIISLEIYPEIAGVLIVAEGVADEKLRLCVINAVSVALDIENSKVEVLIGKKSK